MSTNPSPPSISYSFTMRLAYPNHVGTLARLVNTIGKEGGDIGAVDIVTCDTKGMTRDITVRPRDAAHQEQIITRVCRLAGSR
jgi:(p)ppGpp synthase/HD superfamily hydrolase